MTNSRRKGAAGEREACKALAEHLGLKPRRGQQRAGVDQADIIEHLGGTHCEVKRLKRIAALKYLRQAERDCGTDLPWAMVREDGDVEWTIMVRLKDLAAFIDKVETRHLLDELPSWRTENLTQPSEATSPKTPS